MASARNGRGLFTGGVTAALGGLIGLGSGGVAALPGLIPPVSAVEVFQHTR